MLASVVVQSLSHVRLCDLTNWAHQAPLSSTISQNLLRFMSIESVILSNHLIPCCPFLLLLLIFPSIRIFSNESALCIRWPKYWSFSISSSNEYAGLISFRIEWFDLLAIQGTLKSILQHHNSKAQRSQYIHTCKTCLETSKEFKAIGLRDLQEGRVGWVCSMLSNWDFVLWAFGQRTMSLGVKWLSSIPRTYCG